MPITQTDSKPGGWNTWSGSFVGAWLAMNIVWMLILAVCLWTAPTPVTTAPVEALAAAKPTALVKRVVDGDTLIVDVQLIGDVWLKDAPMRLEGIDCPEMNTAEGKQAKAFAEQWLADNVNRTHKIEIAVQLKRDKYGRLLGDVRYSLEPPLSKRLLEAGLAREVDW